MSAPDGFSGVTSASSMPDWYTELLGTVRRHVSTGRRLAQTAVTQQVAMTYWHIGQEILQRQHLEGYGYRVIDRLSADLKHSFPDTKGYSPRNLRYMRAFAAAWPDPEILQRSVAHLPWRHQVALLEKLDDSESREWYAARAIEEGWSRDILAWKIETRLRERSGKAITNFAEQLPPEQSDMVQQATKDPYLFDFLGATEPKVERGLEQALMDHVTEFLLELGQGFALVGRQVRLTLGGDEFYPDLLFYHVRLRRYVVVELKAVRFQPEFVGKLGLYLTAVDRLLAQDDETPTIGLLLCKTKNAVVAEWAVQNQKSPIGVAEWATRLTDSLTPELAADLPSIETLEAELSDPPEHED